MKKFFAMVLSAILCLSLSACGRNALDTTEAGAGSRSKEELIKEAVSKYYLINEPMNDGELKIYNTKTFKDKYLVLSEKHFGDGHIFTNLFLIDGKYNVIAWTDGETPISMGFSLNKVDYDGSTILFGTFNKSKWDFKLEKEVTIEISRLDIKFADNENIKEDVSIDSGYIVISNSTAKVEEFNILNERNELQSSLDELGYGVERKFNEVMVK